VDVAGKLSEICIRFNQYGIKPTLKKMARPFVLCVEVVGIGTIHMLHDLRQIA
jgi:hypothetical protein